MTRTTRQTLWAAFGTLFVFVTLAATMNIIVLQQEKRQYSRVIQVYEPLLEAIMKMDGSVSSMLAAARGYTMTRQTQFLSQYDDAIREFESTATAAATLATEPRDSALVNGMRDHFQKLKELSDEEISLSKSGNTGPAIDTMLEAARIRRSAYDFAGAFAEKESVQRGRDEAELDGLRLAVTFLLIIVSVAILFVGVFAVLRIERSLEESLSRQVRRTEAIVAGMGDGVMLVDHQGCVVFINPAGVRLLDNSTIGTPIEEQAAVYRFRSTDGKPLETGEIPAAQALGSGKPVRDALVAIDRGEGKEVTVSMNAVPLKEEGAVTGVIVSFRDVTERRRLEEEMQSQAERALILADAGAFFSSTIDPGWVTQAIAERVAEVLGDWAAVVLKTPGSNELRVASIYHRDMASLGLAWAFIYRQPLVVGEGLIGQVASTGYPALLTNFEGQGPMTATDAASYHPVQMKLSSLLVLPLRTRREILGALVIAANDPDRQMTDQKLPLAELMTERAAVAIENTMLYAEQVEARRKMEDLSRLKDEFLSIASHELRTPVTSIKGYTQLAKALIAEEDLPPAGEYLDVALDQIDRMSRLILELLDVSRIETGRLEIRREPIEWKEFVENIVKRHHAAFADRTIELDQPEKEIRIAGDRDRLEQVLGNLLENAVKYSPDGSGVEVRVRNEGDRVVTSISDHGIGIPADELNQVFERFHRGRDVSVSNYGGLGLGLYIAKQIVERHDGSIWVESRQGEGTTFHFGLPVERIMADSAKSSAQAQPA
ncbi:MAG: ATP-binding protein [Thermoanaerobaculia bacterium]